MDARPAHAVPTNRPGSSHRPSAKWPNAALLRHLCVWLLALAVTAPAFASTGYVLVQAHRGYSEIYPENTLLAIERAFDVGADRVETDLGITQDGHVVLMHDRTVDRTTDGSGRVSSFTLAELKELDAGAWKDERFAGERVPTLREALEAAEGRGELNLEIKSNDRSILEVSDVVERAVEVVKELAAEDRVVFSSFDFRALEMVRAIDPALRVLIIDWSEGGRGSGLELAASNAYYGVALRAQYVTQERLEQAENAGLFVHIGTGPRPEIVQWIEWGVDGFSADDPAGLAEYLKSKGYRE